MKTAPQPIDPGFRRGILGGLLVTGIAILLGLGAFTWLFIAQRTASIPQLLGRDTQFYAVIRPNWREVPNIDRLRATVPALFDDRAPSPAGQQIDALLDADFSTEVAPWIGNEIALAVSNLDGAITTPALGDLAERSALLFIFASRDDPTATRFLEEHLAAREAKGQRFATITVGEATIYAQEDALNSPVAAFTLVHHYVVFSNRSDALVALAERDLQGDGTLQASPRFAAAQENLPRERLGYVFVERPALERLAAIDSAGTTPNGSFTALANLDNLALAVSAVDAGAQFDVLGTLPEGVGGDQTAQAAQISDESLAMARTLLNQMLALTGAAPLPATAPLRSLGAPTLSEAGLVRSRLLLELGE